MWGLFMTVFDENGLLGLWVRKGQDMSRTLGFVNKKRVGHGPMEFGFVAKEEVGHGNGHNMSRA